MIKLFAFSKALILALLLACPPLYGQIVSEPFEFEFEQKTLRGLIEKPLNKTSKAVIIIIPGYGETNFVEGKWYYTLRSKLVATGLTVVLWDKMGCGNSEGEFDANQPVENSADEALVAIQKIKRLKIAGSEKIGLWGLSRGGWICPLINEKFPIDFWISVSGTDDKENYGYLLKSNLLIAGKAEAEAEKLFNAWKLGHKLQCTNGSYEDFLKAIEPLTLDSTSRRLFGYTTIPPITAEGIKAFKKDQQNLTSKGYFDTESGLWVIIEDFDQTLLKLNCPVLALFGANDSQVDWRKTKKLYEETIGINSKAELSIKVFENCNHNLQKCRTCAYGEDLSALNWVACDNYYETMEVWLRKYKFI